MTAVINQSVILSNIKEGVLSTQMYTEEFQGIRCKTLYFLFIWSTLSSNETENGTLGQPRQTCFPHECGPVGRRLFCSQLLVNNLNIKPYSAQRVSHQN